MRIFRTLKTGISNLWAWLPIIWKDRDWDSWFIYQIIEFKLRRQSDYIGRNDRHTRAREDAKDMLICAELINKVKDSYYDSEYTDYHESEMVFTDVEDKPDYSKIDIIIISEDFDSYFTKFPTWHKRSIKFIKENQKRFTTDHNDKKLVAMIMGDLRQEKAKDLVFRIMAKKINRWWD